MTRSEFTDSAIMSLVGATIDEVSVGDDGNVVIESDRGRFVVACEGDCCAQAYFSDLEMCELPAVVAEWTAGEYTSVDERAHHDEAHDTQFIKIRTDRGYIDFTLHVEHNGYYGGEWFIAEAAGKRAGKCKTCWTFVEFPAESRDEVCEPCAYRKPRWMEAKGDELNCTTALSAPAGIVIPGQRWKP